MEQYCHECGYDTKQMRVGENPDTGFGVYACPECETSQEVDDEETEG